MTPEIRRGTCGRTPPQRPMEKRKIWDGMDPSPPSIRHSPDANLAPALAEKKKGLDYCVPSAPAPAPAAGGKFQIQAVVPSPPRHRGCLFLDVKAGE